MGDETDNISLILVLTMISTKQVARENWVKEIESSGACRIFRELVRNCKLVLTGDWYRSLKIAYIPIFKTGLESDMV